MSKKITFSIIILVILSGATLPFALRIWDPFWNPFRPNPKDVIKEMTINLKELKELEASLQLKADLQNKEEISLEGKFEIEEDLTDSQNPYTLVDFQIGLQADKEMEFLLAGEMKTLGENSYLKLATFPELPLLDLFFQKMGINLSEVKNQWLELKPGFFGDLPKNIRMGLKGLITDKDFYLVEEELQDEIFEGEDSYHYLVVFNVSKITDLLTQLWPVLGEGIKEKRAGRGEMWIGKDDLRLFKLKGETEINLEKIGEIEEGIIKVNFEVTPKIFKISESR